MSVDMNTLMSGQRDIHGRMSRSVDNLRKLGSSGITLCTVETRMKILDQLWAKFETQHELIRACYKDKFTESEYATEFFDTVENTYVQQRSKLAEYAERFEPSPTTAPAPPAPHGEQQTSDRTPKTALPRIKLQHFSGEYADWPSFRDLFLSVIGGNSSISNVERFHYLRSCLQGPAERLIRPLAVTGENYDRAWALLSKHYENKRELIRSNFAAFTAVTRMKGDTAEELGRIYHAVTTAVNAAESFGRPINSHGMDLFNYLAIELFDSRTRLEWESSTSSSAEPPNHDALLDFIGKRILTLNAARPKGAVKVAVDSARPARTHLIKRGYGNAQCALCKEGHSIMQCREFKAKPASERKTIVETSRLCFNCLGNHTVARCQSTKGCFTCKARHHTLLHDAYANPKSEEVSTLSAVLPRGDGRAILLATARIIVSDRYGNPHTTRALIDQGSEVSIISEALAQRLRLPRTRSAVSIIGIGGAPTGATHGKVKLMVSSKATGTELSVIAFILPQLSTYRSTTTRHCATWPHIQGLTLADPNYLDDAPIEVLLGAEVCSLILEEGLRKGGPDAPVAQKTILGWILSGGCGTTPSTLLNGSHHCTADHELAEMVLRFWEQEREPAAPVALTPAEEECELFFQRTHNRNDDGRYVVRLPFFAPPTNLAETRRPAERLLSAMERKSNQEPHFGHLYRAFMTEYEDLEHMELVRTSSTEDKGLKCYLPHHGVLRDSSATTKLRVVFNGSQKTRSGESLNSKMHVGANLLPSLADVLLRWRRHQYAFITDIEKMYRQVFVHPADRNFQRILWRPDVTSAVREFKLTTVTYGLACAPFLAIRTLHQLATDERTRYPRGAASLQGDCYVDDIVTGTSTLSDAVSLQTELRKLCTAGGFPLRKWAANHEEILTGIPPEHRLQKTSHLWEEEAHSTLGLRWHSTEDHFTFAIHPRTITNLTKRRVLAETARLFDPHGWLAPVIIRAKILIQSAWLQHLEWDTPLPSKDALLWSRFFEELPLLERLRVRRWLGTGSTIERAELHGFADASERGYAAAAYLRVSQNGTTTTQLLTAKSKVAPVKQVSLPRLELCAAALLTQLIQHTRDCLSLSTASINLWTDSTVTLHWLRGHASRWKTYVANRVSQIQQCLPEAQWRHVPGRDNPADCASRGIAPSELVDHPLWWSGPAWLREDKAFWPSENPEVLDDNLLERRTTAQSCIGMTHTEPEILLRFSSLHRLQRVTAWCLRWRRPAVPKEKNASRNVKPTLQADELDTALSRWLRRVQGLHYPDEVAAIAARRPVSPKSRLAKLSPFLDENSILRVGGRLKHAILSQDERHPMIVPTASWLTQLLVEACHRRTLHGGVQLTLGLLRLRFWIPQGRSRVRQLLHRCVICTRWRAATPQTTMGNLPHERVTPARPFLRTGVDYAGPIQLRTSKGRGQKTLKGFIAVFVCLCTKAVHLDVVSDYTSDAFLAAFRRFTSRRGLCEEMYSDCGTNFIGADNALRELFTASSTSGRRIAHAATTEGIKWRFNPPAAPHFGGLWEAAVKSTKHHLRRVIGETTLTFEEMTTLLAQIEACLNSRPLRALSDDPDDISALTPGHFLIGAPLLAVPEPSLIKEPGYSLSRWQHLQKMRDHFWERWSREYIQQFTSKPKWLTTKDAPKVGDLCLIRSEVTPPSRWPLARITKLHPGDDGIVRVVTVRTPASELVRPLVKIVLLPEVTDTATAQQGSCGTKINRINK